MQEADVAEIVPSTRDLLRALDTRRRNLALLGVIEGDAAAAEAARLSDLNVSAFACAEPGRALGAAAAATKTVPSLSLATASERDEFLAARRFGADGVCIDAALPLDTWDRLAKIARTMRMLPAALATDAAGVDGAIKSGARALVIKAESAATVVELAAKAPRGMVLIGWVEGGDAEAVRALAGKVDAAVVPAAVHAHKSFAELVAEVDP